MENLLPIPIIPELGRRSSAFHLSALAVGYRVMRKTFCISPFCFFHYRKVIAEFNSSVSSTLDRLGRVACRLKRTCREISGTHTRCIRSHHGRAGLSPRRFTGPILGGDATPPYRLSIAIVRMPTRCRKPTDPV